MVKKNNTRIFDFLFPYFDPPYIYNLVLRLFSVPLHFVPPEDQILCNWNLIV